MSTYLVTGATGFVGRALIRRLLQQGHSVRAATRGPAQSLEGLEAASVSQVSLGDPNALAALAKLRIDALVCVGGDDMVRSAAAIERRSAIKVVQVPKSIDNDLWLPLPLETLGYETARHVGVELVARAAGL